jgi:hypothetical protein
MRSITRSRVREIVLIITAVLCLSLLARPFAGQQQVSHSKQPAIFTKTPVKSYEQLQSLAAEVKRGRLPEHRLLEKIEQGGLAFDITEDEVAELEAAGASQRIVADLRRLIPEPTPLPPPPQDGSLVISCEPVDCSISIDDGAKSQTKDGKLDPISLHEGQHKVVAVAENYRADTPERDVSVKGGGSEKLIFHFTPTRAAFEAAAKQVYQHLVDALGGEGALKDASKFSANGPLELSDRDGKHSTWHLNLYYDGPARARFELTRGNKKYTALYNIRAGYKWDKDKAPLEAPELEDVLFRICEFQVDNILHRLGSPPFTLVSDRVAPDFDSTLRAAGGPDVYVIQMDSVPHVTGIRIESAGLNNGLRAVYGNYTSGPQNVYPQLTQIMFPDKRGVEIHFTELKYNPSDLTENLFEITKKRK